MQINLNKRATFVIIFTFFAVFYTLQYFQKQEIKFPISLKNKNTKNWYDFEALVCEQTRKGLGEQGEPTYLNDPEEVKLNEQFIEKTGFSVVVSNKISVNRSLLQAAVHPDCQRIEYLSKLPSASIIIIFHNEVYSVLLRTIHSVFNRTPKELLHEIILVNDDSSEVELYRELQQYVSENFPKNVIKIKNLTKRSGLIVARMEGARLATGEILVFFDSHVEVHHNWLPPLLEPLVKNPKIATLPIIDYFDYRTFGYIDQRYNQGTRGIFDWYLDFHELPKLPADQIDNLKPFRNPIMLGCAFAINRKFFLYELGGYDEELRIWNGENYELSFKLWMCRDGILSVPCSRVVHSFRDINPSRKFKEDYVARNFKRIAEVWLDEFKTLPYQLEPKRYEVVDAGNLTAQHELRKRLQCKSFRWFLKNVAPDMVAEYPPLAQLPVFASGAIQNNANPRFCLDNFGSLFGEKIGIYECANDLLEPGKNQKFFYTFYKDLRQIHVREEYCLDSYMLKMSECNKVDFGNQFWKYNLKSREISVRSDDGRSCLTLFLTNDTLGLDACNGRLNQQWNFGYVNATAFKQFSETFGYSNIAFI